MTKRTYLSSVQLILLVVGCALITPYTYLPAVNTPPSNQDVWITCILSFFYALVLSVPIFFLANKFKGIAFCEYLDGIFGKFFGKVTSFLYALYLLFAYVVSLLVAITFIRVFIIPDTAMWVIVLFLIVPTTYLAYQGMGTLGRMATFVVPYVLLTIIIFLLMGISIMDFEVLQPILTDSTFLSINLGAFIIGSKVSEVLMFIVLSEFVFEKINTGKSIITSMGVITLFFVMMLLPTLSVLGIDIAKHAWNPYYLYTRQVRAYDFIQRVESLNALGWLMGSLLKLAAYNFMASYCLTGIFKNKNHKWAVPIVSAIGIIVAYLPFLNKSDVVDILRSNQIIAWTTIPFTVVIPIVIIIVYFMRRKTIDPKMEELKTRNNE